MTLAVDYMSELLGGFLQFEHMTAFSLHLFQLMMYLSIIANAMRCVTKDDHVLKMNYRDST